MGYGVRTRRHLLHTTLEGLLDQPLLSNLIALARSLRELPSTIYILRPIGKDFLSVEKSCQALVH